MGLFDKRRQWADQAAEIWARLGKLEGEVESLQVQWVSWKDEMKRLLQRLEKRDQRAAQREAVPAGNGPTDDFSQRVLRRRRAVSQPSS